MTDHKGIWRKLLLSVVVVSNLLGATCRAETNTEPGMGTESNAGSGLNTGAGLHISTAAGAERWGRIAVKNAEDMALVAGGDWVIASSMATAFQGNGGLYAVATETHTVYPLNLQQMAERTFGDAGQTGSSDCHGPVAGEVFQPHGIAMQTVATTQETLFVVNHGGREAIEIYRIEPGSSLQLHWQGCIPLPEGAMANAVAVTPDFQVFVSNMGARLDGPAKTDRWMGDILVWSADTGWDTVSGSEVFAPNGLLVSDDGSQLYVNSWAGGKIHHLDRSGSGQPMRRELSTGFLPDNLRWGKPGEILATGLRGTPEQVGECVIAPGDCAHSIPTAVAEISLPEFSVACLRYLPLQMGTSAIAVNNSLWVGPVRGESIWTLDLQQPASARCQRPGP